MPHTSIVEGLIIANRLLKAVSDISFPLGENNIHVKISLGITEANGSDKCIEQTINRADKALYQAKAVGGNKVAKIN